MKTKKNGEKDASKKTKYYFAYARETECQTSYGSSILQMTFQIQYLDFNLQ